MFLKKMNLIVVFLLISIGISFSQEDALSKIDKEDLERYLTFISSDSLQGRRFGTEVPGLDITADYLKTNAKRIGLSPGGEDYFQKFDLVSTQPDKNGFIEVIGREGESAFKTTKLVNLNSASGDILLSEEEVVFAGFGYRNTETGCNDLAKIDIRNKVVVIAQGSPVQYKTDKNASWNNGFEWGKFRMISEKKPKAIILITSPNDKEAKTYSSIARWMNRKKYDLISGSGDVPVLLSTPETADQILGRKGKFKKYLNSISKRNKPKSFLVESRKLNVAVKPKLSVVEAKNVVGIVEGSDPVLKDECVVFVAHYDHLGVRSDGEIYNGADDNGSGTVTLLEVAEAFMSLKQKPKRSIVFLWVTAEEIGLLGSRYYSENPVIPLEKTVTSINIDMDGRVYEPRDSVWKRSPKMVKDFDGLFTVSNDVWPKLKEISDANCKRLGLIPDSSLPARFLRSSDHYHFHNKGVPVLNFATGYHADYHKVGDEISKINFDKIKRVSDLCFLVGLEIANQDKIERKQ